MQSKQPLSLLFLTMRIQVTGTIPNEVLPRSWLKFSPFNSTNKQTNKYTLLAHSRLEKMPDVDDPSTEDSKRQLTGDGDHDEVRHGEGA